MVKLTLVWLKETSLIFVDYYKSTFSVIFFFYIIGDRETCRAVQLHVRLQDLQGPPGQNHKPHWKHHQKSYAFIYSFIIIVCGRFKVALATYVIYFWLY